MTADGKRAAASVATNQGATGKAGTVVPAVELRGVTKRYGAVRAVGDVSLTVRRGEFLTLLGPSGCGKTTLLRMIAGFDIPDSGVVLLGGNDVTQVPPYRRDVNQVFQSYALFPHLSVRDNIAFGLRMQRLASPEIKTRVAEVVTLVALAGCEDRMPHQLSGGQRQRVALARALAPRPAVLLLDEPLSALDARLRRTMQIELKRLQRQVGTTFIFVTHDQEEALTISDRIALIHQGRIEQCDDVHAIYHRPATAFAADFIGEANLFEAERLAIEGESVLMRVAGSLELRVPLANWPADVMSAKISVRPEKVHLSRVPLEEPNSFEVRVEEEIFTGVVDRFVLTTESGLRINAVRANESALRETIHAGDRVWCAIHADDIVVVSSGPNAG
jgi:spermidine/putrescine transport system ATP-binding protein